MPSSAPAAHGQQAGAGTLLRPSPPFQGHPHGRPCPPRVRWGRGLASPARHCPHRVAGGGAGQAEGGPSHGHKGLTGGWGGDAPHGGEGRDSHQSSVGRRPWGRGSTWAGQSLGAGPCPRPPPANGRSSRAEGAPSTPPSSRLSPRTQQRSRPACPLATPWPRAHSRRRLPLRSPQTLSQAAPWPLQRGQTRPVRAGHPDGQRTRGRSCRGQPGPWRPGRGPLRGRDGPQGLVVHELG